VVALACLLQCLLSSVGLVESVLSIVIELIQQLNGH
jgi:hypothetical protein